MDPVDKVIGVIENAIRQRFQENRRISP